MTKRNMLRIGGPPAFEGAAERFTRSLAVERPEGAEFEGGRFEVWMFEGCRNDDFRFRAKRMLCH
jgi:hypothetical protein